MVAGVEKIAFLSIAPKLPLPKTVSMFMVTLLRATPLGIESIPAL